LSVVILNGSFSSDSVAWFSLSVINHSPGRQLLLIKLVRYCTQEHRDVGITYCIEPSKHALSSKRHRIPASALLFFSQKKN
jgi:hypothetical protein